MWSNLCTVSSLYCHLLVGLLLVDGCTGNILCVSKVHVQCFKKKDLHVSKVHIALELNCFLTFRILPSLF